MAVIKNSLIALAALLLLASCDEKRVFDEYKEFDGTWNKDSIASFTYEAKDTTSYYNVYLTTRTNNSYPYSNLFVIIQMEQPGTKLINADTLEYQMANPDGTLMGNGFSDIKESALWFRKGMRFPKAGAYKFSIQQAVRQSGKVPGVQELDGITEIGLRIETKE